MRISNKFAAWFYLSTVMLGTLVATLQVLFDIRGLIMDPPDVVVYVSSPELKGLAREEWAEYESRYGDNDRMGVKVISAEELLGEELKDKTALALIDQTADTPTVAGLESGGVKVDAFRILTPSGKEPISVFLVEPEKQSRAARNFSDFLKSATAKEVASEYLAGRKGRLS
ncbi:MAG: hypothetical protein J5I94_25485 [Phaeodactylibacter sp.]|nr:hypothetical protein [Phaeodactylibacter sp.]